MDHEREELLAQKKEQLKIKRKRAEIQQYKDRLAKSIEHFSQKYRYSDETEALKIGELYYQVQHLREIKRSSYRTLVE